VNKCGVLAEELTNLSVKSAGGVTAK